MVQFCERGFHSGPWIGLRKGGVVRDRWLNGTITHERCDWCGEERLFSMRIRVSFPPIAPEIRDLLRLTS